jgi:lipopolysaccharide/colanic/teichoic acid biosynthesis glycosyltransferase
MKRVFDVVVAASALLLLSPLFLIMAILIKLDSPGRCCSCNAARVSIRRRFAS